MSSDQLTVRNALNGPFSIVPLEFRSFGGTWAECQRARIPSEVAPI